MRANGADRSLAVASTATLVDFGGVAIELASDDTVWLDVVAVRYGVFAGARDAAFRVECRVAGAAPPDLASPLAVRNEAHEAERTARGFRLRSKSFTAEVDLERRRALLGGPAAAYPLDALLRHLLPVLVEDGVILHAAALADGDARGWICSGPSGAGKSTLASLAGPRALSDELAVARLEGEGARVASLPFWQARPGSAPLEAIYMLRHGARHARVRIGPAEAVRLLSRQTVWPAHDPGATRRTFAALATLVERVPVWELAFRPEPDVWDVIAGGG